MHLEGKTAVVTGAAGGIGRAIAMSLARRGCALALVDLDEAGLAQTRDLIANVPVSLHRLDVADAGAVAALPAGVLATHAAVDLLVNNAGVAVGGTFEQVSPERFDWLFAINFHGLVRMTRAFLPLLKTRPEARIVNISSIFGIVAVPGQAAYCASKFAVRGFSEALRAELANGPVGVTQVHPGGVATAIARNAPQPEEMTAEQTAKQLARYEKLLTMPPATAGEIIVKSIERGQNRVIVGGGAKLLDILQRLAPSSYWNLLRRWT